MGVGNACARSLGAGLGAPPPPATRGARRACRSGADKVSIGSDAVLAVEEYLGSGGSKDGKTAIEQISRVYGAQVCLRVWW